MRSDFVVIGGGVIGLNVACELKRRYADCSVLLLEKEAALGQHASGRNSGVLHAGFYYTTDSLKARFTAEGNAAMTAWCEERRLRIRRCGKLVVTKNAAELDALDELFRRGRANGVQLEMLAESEARSIEPRVRTFERALFSPTTSTVDAPEVMRSFGAEADRLGIEVLTGAANVRRAGDTVLTTAGAIAAGFVVNAAGLYADRIAQDFGFGERYRILPFKGLYLYSNQPAGFLTTNLYPVPDMRFPFLGVHFMVTVDGRTKFGPTAIPCLWREQYGGREGFRADEAAEILMDELRLMVGGGFDFRGLALKETRKYWRPHLVAQAAQMADGVNLEDYRQWGRPGIRAQLIDVRQRTLVSDFVVEGDDRSIHILNAVSPAFTCAIPFSRYVCDRIAAPAA